MRNRRTRVVTVMMFSLIMILSSIYLPKNTLAATAPTMRLDPSDNQKNTSQTSVGSRFNVTAHVQNAFEIAAWQIYVEFNDDILNVTRWFEPTTDANYIFAGKTTSPNPTPPNPDYVHLGAGKGRIQVGSLLFPVFQPTSSGNGTLCIIEFVVTQAPTSGQLSCPLRINVPSTTLLDADGYDIPDIIKEDGTYTLTFDVAPPPYLAVNPSSVTYRPLQSTTDQPLILGVFVNDVSTSVSLKTVSLSLSYNQSLLSTESSNVTLDSLWGSGNSVTVSDGLVNITVTNPTSTPNGNVLVGNIAFTILRETSPPEPLGHSANTTLGFVNRLLLNNAGDEIAQASPINGVVRMYAYSMEPVPLTLTEPAVVGFGRLIVNGASFEVNMTIGEVFDLKEVRVYIHYDPSVINCTDLVLVSDLY